MENFDINNAFGDYVNFVNSNPNPNPEVKIQPEQYNQLMVPFFAAISLLVYHIDNQKPANENFAQFSYNVKLQCDAFWKDFLELNQKK